MSESSNDVRSMAGGDSVEAEVKTDVASSTDQPEETNGTPRNGQSPGTDADAPPEATATDAASPTATPDPELAAGQTAEAVDASEAPSGSAESSDAEADDGVAQPSTPAAAAAAPSETASAAGADTEKSGSADAEKSDGKKQAPRARRHPQSATLYRAYRSNRPIEGKIEKVIKGGYEVKVGKSRGFCPHSQMDVIRVEDPESLVGTTAMFRITQVRRGGADVVLSRRAVLEDERKEEAAAVRATLIEGAVMQGHVAGLADFGAFVDLGAGVMGLVHVSELSHARTARVQDAVQVGQTVEVKILKLQDGGGRISLSISQAQEDPWVKAAEKFQAGQTHTGTVQRVADFGAFVELDPGIEALAPKSEFPPSRIDWSDQLTAGTERDWFVLSTDPRKRRISVIPVVEGVDLETSPPVEVGEKVKGRVQRHERFGVFVWLGAGKVALMPNALSGTPPGSDLSRRFPVGDEIEVEITEISEDRRRIRVAAPNARQRPGGRPPRGRKEPRPTGEAARARHEPPKSDQVTGTFGTSLADKLKAALDRSKE